MEIETDKKTSDKIQTEEEEVKKDPAKVQKAETEAKNNDKIEPEEEGTKIDKSKAQEIEMDKKNNDKIQTEEEEVKFDPTKTKSAKLIQAFYRDYLKYKRVRALADEADFLQKNPVKPQDPSEESVRQLSLKQSFYVKKLPTEAWINIFSYVAQYEQLLKIATSCKLFEQICKMNILWLHSLKVSWPLVHEKYDFNTINVKDINWRDIVKEKCLLLQAFKKIIKSMHEAKDKGNALYQEGKIEEAAKCFKDGIEFMKEAKKDMELIQVVPKDVMIESLRISAILLSNASMAEGKLENWPKAFYDAIKARKKLRVIKELMNDNEEYKKVFGNLEDKVIFRMKIAWVHFPFVSFVRYSDQIVEGVGVGSMIEATENIRGGIFGNSKLIMIDYDRGSSIKGVIINKSVTFEGKRIRIGGPCDMQTVTVLHNIPHAEGAKPVIEGVWVGGDVEPYREDPNYKINEYYGHASWFDGQLDGELRHNDWTWHNNATSEMIFQDY